MGKNELYEKEKKEKGKVKSVCCRALYKYLYTSKNVFSLKKTAVLLTFAGEQMLNYFGCNSTIRRLIALKLLQQIKNDKFCWFL